MNQAEIQLVGVVLLACGIAERSMGMILIGLILLLNLNIVHMIHTLQ